jgi:hypothetical protein
MKCVLLTALLVMAPVLTVTPTDADTTNPAATRFASKQKSQNKPKQPACNAPPPASAASSKSYEDQLYGDIKHPILNTAIGESLAGKPIYDFQLRALNADMYYDSAAQGVYLQKSKAFVQAEKDAVEEFSKRVIGRSKLNIVDAYGPPSADLGSNNPWTADKPNLSYSIYDLGYENNSVILTFDKQNFVRAEPFSFQLRAELERWMIPDKRKVIGKTEAEITKHLGEPKKRQDGNGFTMLYYPIIREKNIVFVIKNGICVDCEDIYQSGWQTKPGSIQNRTPDPLKESTTEQKR